MSKLARLAATLLVALSPWLTASRPQPQISIPLERAAELAGQLTPQEKVGQLALVTFAGSQALPDSQIVQLVTQYHIGGVVLRKENDNMLDAPDTLTGLQNLINQLQTAEWEDSRIPRVLEPGNTVTAAPAYIPLLVGVEQGGDGLSSSSIGSGVTTLPSAMALGATWDPAQAQSIGEVAGKELAALGVNLLLGPDLDVLETPDPEGPGDLRSQTFGGDPFWVGAMGRSTVAGLHLGSQGRLAVFARHFPGLGSSNRKTEEEVPTVRRTLDKLQQVELAPFFAVTGGAPDEASTADGVIAAHIRFQGLQGNIRATTRPVSLDPQALQLLTSLPGLADWRAGGGLVLSDSLGSNAIKRFYDTAYNGKLVARDALLAGNDLLYLSQFQSPGDADDFAAITATLDFFAQKYREDTAFAQRVDEALLRVLQLKFRLYPRFTPDQVLKSPAALAGVGKNEASVFEVAKGAATLISPPTAAELAERLPDPPQLGEHVVFITDARTDLRCSTCAPSVSLGVDTLEQAVLRLYGPQASGQVRTESLESFSYKELQAYLDGTATPPATGEGTPAAPIPIQAALDRADWIIFSQLDLNPEVPWSGALKQFLAQRPDLLRNRKVVVFAFSAPYYLDTTETTALTAYFGLYSRAPAFVDVAARLLFQEVGAPGASPVSVAGVGYDLFTITQPDPNQTINLTLELPILEGTPTPEAGTATPEALPVGLRLGDQVKLVAGPILDHNDHFVPDGTVVRFSENFLSENIPPLVVEATTQSGFARASFRLDRIGLHEFRVASDPAQRSQTLQIDVPQEGSGFFTQVAPPTQELTASSEPTSTLPPILTETPAVQPTPAPPAETEKALHVSPADLALALFASAGLMALGWRMGQRRKRLPVRLALAALIGSLAGYNYMALRLPGAELMLNALGRLAVILSALAGGAVGLGLGRFWLGRGRNQNQDT